jgi:hypothetical protein
MSLTTAKTVRTASLWLAVCFFAGACSDVQLEPPSQAAQNTDSQLSLTGTVCTSTPDPSGFPVKVVFIVDQSGSMCISDPPGSQNGQGFCEQTQVKAIIPPGVTQPARVRALEALLTQFKTESNVYVSLVPFETNVQTSNVWPTSTAPGTRFARPDSTLDADVTGLQSLLGNGTDYQGAFAYAYGIIADDIQYVSQTNPQILPRTRYVVVFLTDGTPYPRCAADNTLTQYADPDHPWLIFASDVPSFCDAINALPPSQGGIVGFTPGTDRNQNYQIFSYVDQLMQLQQQYNVGDVRIHTVLLYNVAAIQACGPICQDVYGTYPGVPPSQYAADTKKIATWLLQQIAMRGNGVYQEFLDGNIQSLGLGALNYASLASRNVLKQLIVQNMTAIPGPDGWQVDSDGDGLSNDTEFSLKTSTFNTDSDGDCFSDNFEVMHKDQGFDPLVPDSRGCVGPLAAPGRDTDGDGLTQYEEAFLGTNPGLADSDGDGIPDGFSARYRLDPLAGYKSIVDTDGDGLDDRSEMRANSNPISSDLPFYKQFGIRYSTTEKPNPDGSTCYDFAITNIQMTTPPSQGNQQGYNLFKIYFAEAPESGYASDYGVWRTACAWAQYDPPVRIPVGTAITFQDTDFIPPYQMILPADYQTQCVIPQGLGTPP